MNACPKCGCTGTGNIWQGQMGFGSDPAPTIRFCVGGDPSCRSMVAVENGKEHLDIICGRCGYAGAAPCKDARP